MTTVPSEESPSSLSPKVRFLAGAARRLEIIAWSLVARVLIKTTSLETSLGLLDRLPRFRSATQPIAAPPESSFAIAGACLARSIARSQFLRVRGHSSTIVIGVRGGTNDFAAHAWLDGLDDEAEDFVAIRRVSR